MSTEPDSRRPEEQPRALSRRVLIYVGLGFFASVAQVLLFRRFFEVFEGHELGLGCFYASWLLWVALGAAAGRLWNRTRASVGSFDPWPLLYLPAFALQWFLTDRARGLAGVAPQDLFPFLQMAPAAVLVNAPLSFVTGLLFARACGTAAGTAGIVGRVYAWEAAGGFAGGLSVVAALAMGMTEERAAILAAASLAVFAAAGSQRRTFIPWACALAALAVLAVGVGADAAWCRTGDRTHWQRLMGSDGVTDGRFVTPQATYRYGTGRSSWVVLSRESVCEALPSEERAAQIAALHVACAPHARRVLIVGPGAWAVGLAFLKLDGIDEVVWLHPDPAYPQRMRALVPAAYRADPARLVTPARDAREYLEHEDGKFDVVVLAVPDALSLGMNRYATREFLALVRTRLAEGGVLGMRVSGGDNVLGAELATLGASVLATVESVFPHVFLRPGGETWIVGTDRATELWTPRLLGRAFASLPGSERLGPMELVTSQFPPGRADFQMGRYRQVLATAPDATLINSDAHPRALEHGLLLTLKQGGVSGVTGMMRGTLRPTAVVLIFGLGFLPLLRTLRILRAAGGGRSSFDPVVMTFAAGMAGMTLSVGFMCAYQARYGELFLHAGVLSSLYMLGLFAGALLARRSTATAGSPFLWPASAMLLLLGLAGWAVLALGAWTRLDFAIAFLLAGCAGGLPVPPAARGLREAGIPEDAAGARVEASDTLGGAVGSLVVAWLVLPTFGLPAVMALSAVLACAILPVLASTLRGTPLRGVEDPTDRWARRLGYATGAAAALALIGSFAVRSTPHRAVADPLDVLAAQMCTSRTLHPLRVEGPAGPSPRFLGTEASVGASDEFLWSTSGWAPVTMGFGGPIEMVLRTARDGRLIDFRMSNLRETPSYFAGIARWLNSLKGQSVFAPLPEPGTDAISGATVSARAVAQTLSSAGPAFAERVLGREPGGPHTAPHAAHEVTVFLAALAGALLARRYGGRRTRRVFLVAVVAILGFFMNVQYSMVQLHALVNPPWAHPEYALGFVLFAGVPLLSLIFGNMYCGWLCPFGALQELVGDLRPARWVSEPGTGSRRWGRYMKFVVLMAAAFAWAAKPEAALFEVDPLTGFFGGGFGRLFAVGLVILGLSFVFRRFWCRYACPVGAFLSIAGSVRALRRFWPAVIPAWCDLGVRTHADLDCLVCNRCRHAGGPPAGGRRWARWTLACAVVAAAVWMLVGFAQRLPAAPAHPASTTATRASPVADSTLDLIRRQQKAGRLSDHEARHYRAVEPGTVSSPGASRGE